MSDLYNPPFLYPSTPSYTPLPPQTYVLAAVPTYKEPPQQQSPPQHIEYHFHYHYPPLPQAYFDAMSSGKRVHWEDDVPRTPSPAFSTSSDTSSRGPLTPDTYPQSLPQVHEYQPFQYATYLTPQAPYAAKPHYRSPASGTSSPSGFSVHSVLSSAAHALPTAQPFAWNMALHPNQIQSRNESLSSPGYPISEAILALPATSPPTARLLITSPFFPWSIKVSAKDAPFVTVRDVFCEIYQQFRVRVSDHEYQEMCKRHHDYKARIDSAFWSRCSMLRDRANEEKAGLRRVDLLMGSMMFAGLEMRPSTQPEAVLHLRSLV